MSWLVSSRPASMRWFQADFSLTCWSQHLSLTTGGVSHSLTRASTAFERSVYPLTRSNRKLSVEHVGGSAEFQSMTGHFCVSDIWLKHHLSLCCWSSWCLTPSLSPFLCGCVRVYGHTCFPIHVEFTPGSRRWGIRHPSRQHTEWYPFSLLTHVQPELSYHISRITTDHFSLVYHRFSQLLTVFLPLMELEVFFNAKRNSQRMTDTRKNEAFQCSLASVLCVCHSFLDIFIIFTHFCVEQKMEDLDLFL